MATLRDGQEMTEGEKARYRAWVSLVDVVSEIRAEERRADGMLTPAMAGLISEAERLLKAYKEALEVPTWPMSAGGWKV